jgi:hypothetical protein
LIARRATRKIAERLWEMAMAAPEIGLCFGTVHQAQLIEMIEVAARHGFPTLQVPPDLYFACRDEGMSAAALRKRLADAGVRVQLIDAITAGIPGMRTEPVQFKGRTIPRWNAAACLEANDVRLPGGDRLTSRRLRLLGRNLGMSHGFERVHNIVRQAWDGDEISDVFRRAVVAETGFVDMQLYALQEFIYAGRGQATGWAAHRALARFPEFDASAARCSWSAR